MQNRKYALFTLSDKTDSVCLAEYISSLGYKILSTGGTYKYLKNNGIQVESVEEFTGFEEILEGRVKTLHPKIYAGVLAKRDNQEHLNILEDKNYFQIDIVVVNLYPFQQKLSELKKENEIIEFIDIGGLCLMRGAAKNFKFVTILTHPSQYNDFIEKNKNEEVGENYRKNLARMAFSLTSEYDKSIVDFFSKGIEVPKTLRYGENPHQNAKLFIDKTSNLLWNRIEQLNGKELSFNNIRDVDAVWNIVSDFYPEKVFVGVKHTTPCAVSLIKKNKDTLYSLESLIKADSQSIFGGVIASTDQIDEQEAILLTSFFLEIVIAPNFTTKALNILSKKKKLRILKVNTFENPSENILQVAGGRLIQNADIKSVTDFNVQTDFGIIDKLKDEMIFAFQVCKHVKSNAIVTTKGFTTQGISGGQVNRYWAAQQALSRSKDAIVLASDGFLPFPDTAELASVKGIKAIIQPGGSLRDKETVEICAKNRISMVFTGIRHFKH